MNVELKLFISFRELIVNKVYGLVNVEYHVDICVEFKIIL